MSHDHYDLTNQDDVAEFRHAMSDLMVGETLKFSIENSGSIGYKYELVQDGDALKISEREIPFVGRVRTAPTVVEYTIEVKKAGEGNIKFDPHARVGLNMPTLSFDYWSM